jgi:site-specific DNA recombinase
MQNAVIYARYSSDRQDAASIETQIAEGRKKAKAEGLTIIEEYCDEGKSARTTDRPEFQRLLADAKKKPRPFDTVIVRKFDRFARNVTQSRIAKEYLKKLGVRVVSVHEDIDESPAGRFMETIVEAVAEWYSANLSAETKSGQATNTKKGFRNGGYAPYGFKNIKVTDPGTGKIRTKLEIDEQEARAVRFIFAKFAAGDGYLKIINGLVERGLFPRRAKVWNKSVLVAMIDNQAYHGDLIWRKSEDETIVAEGAIPKLIDDDTWKIVQEKRQKNRQDRKPRAATSARPFSGVLFCQFCGSPYTYGSIQKGKIKLLCSSKKFGKGCTQAHYVDEDAMVNAIRRKLLAEIFTPENLVEAFNVWAAEINQDGKKATSEIKALQIEIDSIELRQAKLLEELELGDFPRELLKARMETLQAKRKGLLTQIEDLKKDAILADVKPKKKDLQEFCSLVASSLRQAEGHSFAIALKRLGVKVKLGKRAEIEISPVIMTEDNPLNGAGDPRPPKGLSPARYRMPIPGHGSKPIRSNEMV